MVGYPSVSRVVSIRRVCVAVRFAGLVAGDGLRSETADAHRLGRCVYFFPAGDVELLDVAGSDPPKRASSA